MWNEFLYSIATYPYLYALFTGVMLLWITVGLHALRRVRQAPDERPRLTFKKFGAAFQEALVQRRIWRRPLAGAMHLCLFAAGVLILVAYIMTHHVAPRGEAWQASRTAHFIADLGVMLGFVGHMLAGWRRFIRKETSRAFSDVLLWGLGFVFIIAYGLANALQVAITDPNWQRAAFLSRPIAGLFSGMATLTLRSLYGLVWALVHGSLFVGVLLVPLTKWRHVLAIVVNLAHADDLPPAVAVSEDLNGDGPFGLGRTDQLSKKQLYETWACVRCGRCSTVCPATMTGKMLDPLKLIEAELEAPRMASLPDFIDQEALWQCSMCLACADVCPADIAPWRHLLDMRRERVLEAAEFPQELQGVFRGIERRGNPWGTATNKSEIAREAGVRLLSKGDSCDVLLWMGCMVAVDPLAQQAWRAMAQLLAAADVDVACLGDAEPCCGDAARRLGNEYIWQQQVETVSDAMHDIHVGRVVSVCPHCANTLGNEYPQGLWQGVSHALEELSCLAQEGRIVPEAHQVKPCRVVYHDPCYLARGLDVIDSVRRLLVATPGCELVEPAHKGKDVWCCGAGGGQMWLQEDDGAALGQSLFDELANTKAELILSACPYCDTTLQSEFGNTNDVSDVVIFIANRWRASDRSDQG